MGITVPKLREMHEAQIVAGVVIPLPLADALHLHSELDVLADGEPGKKAQLLENQDAVGARPPDRLAVNQYLTRRWCMQSGNQMQEGGLAAARGPHDAEKLARPNLEIDVIKRQKPFPALRPVTQAYFAQADLGGFGRDLPARVANRSGPKLAPRPGGAYPTPGLREHNLRGFVL